MARARLGKQKSQKLNQMSNHGLLRIYAQVKLGLIHDSYVKAGVVERHTKKIEAILERRGLMGDVEQYIENERKTQGVPA